MPRFDNEIRITLSVLDRLIDYEPEVSYEPPASRASSLRQMKQALKRDLEWLLNTRRCVDEIPAGLKELNHSLAIYGLPDFSTSNIKSPADQTRLRRALENVIKILEPRLKNVTVTLEPSNEMERMLRFQVAAHLMIEPAPEPITFDTVLQINTGEYLIQEK